MPTVDTMADRLLIATRSAISGSLLWRLLRIPGAERAIIAAIVIASMGCGGGDAADQNHAGDQNQRMPTGPSATPIPAANVQFEGDGELTGCFRGATNSRCDFQGTGKNMGPGCATRVRVTVHFVAGETEVGTDNWGSGSSILRPDEQFVYMVRITGTSETLASITGYKLQIEWMNTRCEP